MSQGGRIFKLRWQASQGKTFELPPPAEGPPPTEAARTVQEIDDEWEAVVDFEQGEVSYPQAERQAKILSSPRL